MSEKQWYETGYDGVKKEEERMNSFGMPQRFFMKAGEQKEFVFVSDDPFAIYEHNPKMNGSFKNWITCVRGIHESTPCCDNCGEDSRYYVGMYTVVDCSKFVSARGNTYQYELKFLPAKVKSMKKFKRKKEDRLAAGNGGLVGQMFRATREDAKSPNIGDEFEWVKPADMNKLFELANFAGKKLSELWATANNPQNLAKLQKTFSLKLGPDGVPLPVIPEFNYISLLAPKSVSELTYLLKGKVEKDDDSFGSNKSSKINTDEVPF